MRDRELIAVEPYEIEDARSRLSTAIFLLLCFVPVFNTVLFGGVDNITWVMVPVLAAIIVLLWLIHSWKNDGLVLDTSTLQLPLLGLLAIGLIQLLPLGGASTGDLLSVPASG